MHRHLLLWEKQGEFFASYSRLTPGVAHEFALSNLLLVLTIPQKP
jgi:hypothetical protein